MHTAQARLMASYNRWMSKRLSEVSPQPSDTERKRDLNALFGSMQGTLFTHGAS